MRNPLIITLLFAILSGCLPNYLETTADLEVTQSNSTHTPDSELNSTSVSTDTTESFLLNCLQIDEKISRSNLSDGILVLGSYGYEDSFLYDLSTNTKIRLPREENEILSEFAVSLDRQFLAYSKKGTTGEAWMLQIVDANGEILNSFDWDKNWSHVVGWQDSENLLLSVKTQVDWINQISILNINSGNERLLEPNLPGFWDGPSDPEWGRYYSSRTVYNPQLTMVIYPSFPQGGGDDFGVVLWNLVTNKEVLHFTDVEGFGNEPVWSPDGKKVIINKPSQGIVQEISLINSNGSVSQLTNFAKVFSEVKIGTYSFSPNGAQVAFWLTAEPITFPAEFSDVSGRSSEHLGLLDITEGTVKHLCLRGAAGGGTTIKPVWSPDSRFLIVENRYSYKESKVYLVDLHNNTAAIIAENQQPVGWLAK